MAQNHTQCASDYREQFLQVGLRYCDHLMVKSEFSQPAAPVGENSGDKRALWTPAQLGSVSNAAIKALVASYAKAVPQLTSPPHNCRDFLGKSDLESASIC